MEKREEAALGVRFLCPTGWQRLDKSHGAARVVVFSPSEKDLSVRISLLRLPATTMPSGLETREAGAKIASGGNYHRVRLEPATVLGQPGTIWEYTTVRAPISRTVEYGLRTGDRFYIFQFSAPEDSWAKMDAVFKVALGSVELFASAIARTQNENATMVAMRDGVHLYTHVVLPAATPAPIPTLLIRSPYYFQYFEHAVEKFRPFVEQGYALVYQSVRGSGKSEGQLRPMSQEFADGQDTVRWIVKQPWSNGAVGTFGSSYDGFTALAAAVDTPEVKLVLADGAPTRAFETWPATQSGALSAQLLWWSKAAKGKKAEQMDPEYRHKVTKSRPVRDLDIATFGEADPLWRTVLPYMERHSAYWDDWSLTNKRLSRISAAVINMQAKNEYTSDCLDAFLSLANGGGEQSRAAHRFVLHSGGHGDAIYNPFASTPAGEIIRGYMTKYLKGQPVELDAAPVHYFVQNANEWRTSDHWPVTDKRDTYYLDSQSMRLVDAPKGHGVRFGQLVHTEPTSDGAASYTFDPTVDDACDPKTSSGRLVFETPKLNSPIDVVGRAELVLFVKIDTPDADLFATLLAGGGTPVGQTVGLRLRFRKSMSAPEPMRPGEISEVHLQFNAAAFQFEGNSSISVLLKSTACGLSENPNTGGSMTEETKSRPVKVQILTGPTHPSRLILPTL